MPDSDSDDDLFADSTAETTSNTAALFGVLDLLDGAAEEPQDFAAVLAGCLLYTSPSPRDKRQSRMPSSA